MRRWTVKDVMTENVISVTDTTPYKEIVQLLAQHAVSAVPVVDSARKVIGVVSEADLLHKMEFTGLEPHVNYSSASSGERRGPKPRATLPAI